MEQGSSQTQQLVISPAAKQLAVMIVEENYSPTDIEPKKVKEERVSVEIQKGIEEMSRNLNTSISHIENGLKKYELTTDQTNAAMARIKEQANYVKEHFDEMLKKLDEEHVTFSDLVQVDEDSLDRMYKVAKSLYDESMYKDAVLAFNLLVLLEPDQPVFWNGLGHAAFLSENYDNALEAFTVESSLEVDNPICDLMIAKCHEQLKEYHRALDVLDLLIHKLGKDPQFDSVKEQVKEIKEEISVKMQKHQDEV